MQTGKKTAAAIVRNRHLIMILILLIAVGSAFMIPKTRINYDLNQYLSEDTMTKRALKVMEAEFGELQLGDPEASRDMQNRIGAEMPLVTGISLVIVVAVLLLTSHAWLEPVPILFTLAVSIVINMGTNFIFQNVSFITFAVSAILQLALSIDYAIMLLHTFNGFLEIKGMTAAEAMRAALAECFMRIASSAMTTIAGLLSLLFMSFTIGFDIGMVLSKGIVISMLCVFLLMPAVILIMEKPLRRTRHRVINLGGGRLGRTLWKWKKPVAGVMLLAVCAGLVLNSMTVYSFSESAVRKSAAEATESTGPGTAGGTASAKEDDSGAGKTASGTERPSGMETDFVRERASEAVPKSSSGQNGRRELTFTEETAAWEEVKPAAADPAETVRAVMSANPLVLLIPGGETDEDYDAQRRLVASLQEIRRKDGDPAIGEVLAMVTTGGRALEYYTPGDVARITGIQEFLVQLFFAAGGYGERVRADRLLKDAENLPGGNETVAELRAQLETAREAFIGPHYSRMILSLNFGARDPDFNDCMDAVFAAVRQEYGEDFYVTGTPMSTYDIGHAFRKDLMVVNIITALAILAVVAFSFRSLGIPLLLVLVIEGAIWITMGISVLAGQSVFFISYLICLSIQMGATIDYAILLTDQYRHALRAGSDRPRALAEAMKRALPTVLTSGTILITAGYLIGQVCTIYYISSIGALLARGTLVSVILVLTLLPALLTLFRTRGFAAAE